MAFRRAVFAAKVDDLEVTTIPSVFGENGLQVPLGLFDILSVTQPPPISQAMDMRVDGERRKTECTRHDDAGCLVADASEPFQEIPFGDQFATGIQDLVRHR